MAFTILHDGAEIPPSGTPAPAPNTYEITAAPSPTANTEFPLSIQWQSEGVDLGRPNVRILNFIAALDQFLVSRGTGEQSNVVTVRKLTPPPPPPPSDPFFDDVILLMQNGEIIDRSQYARSLANSGAANSATGGVASDFPGGLAVNMTCVPSAVGGLVMGTGPEMTMGSSSWGIDGFFHSPDAANGLRDSSQIIYTSSDDTSRLQVFSLFNTGQMFIRTNGFNIPFPVSVPFAARGSSWYFAIQFYPGSTVPWVWVGAVGSANATGDQCATITPRPLLGPLSGPYMGYQPTDNFITSNFKLALRITNAVRFAPVPTLAIPTTVWPTIGP